MKLNGAVIQDMINNLLSLGQVITVARLRMQDHIYIEPIKLHTKRMTTSNFAGRAAHDCKSAIFNVRRVVFELFTDTLGPVSSSKHSSTYRENKDTRNRNAIVQLITASSMRQVLNLENLNGSVQPEVRRFHPIDELLAVLISYQADYRNIQTQVKVPPVCAGLKSKQTSLEIQLSISQVRDIPTGQLSRFSVSRAWLLNTVFIKPIKHRIVSDRIENSANGPSGSEHLS